MSLACNKTVIIIPTFNEIDNIEKMIRAVFTESPDFSLLIVEDSSPDGTANIVKQMQNEFPNLYMIKRKSKLGLGSAYITGFKWCLEKKFEYIFEMDCDFSHDPKDLKKLLKCAVKGADLVIGSRYINGIRIINWPFRRLLLSYTAKIYNRMITRIPLLDTTSGFKCIKRSTLEAINLGHIISNGYSFQLELNYRVWVKGMKIIEYPIIFTERRDGQSKMDSRVIIEAILTAWRLRFAKFLGKIS